jgi:NitT/TauT family transport system permease protein
MIMSSRNKSILSQLFELRGELSAKVSLICEVVGVGLILAVWTFVCEMGWINKGILPSPIKIIATFPDLHFNDALLRNLGFSFTLNLLGLIEAMALAIPIGFVIGLFPLFRSVFQRYITSARFLPLSALTGIFISAFGLFTNMKIQFLTLSIFVYLLAAIIQRVYEVEKVYQQTAFTLAANKWQTIKTVFIPAVISRSWDDIRNLSALSWTYITIAEMVNAGQGGVGVMAYKFGRFGRVDKAFAILVVIVVVGIIWDKLLIYLDKIFFSYKYSKARG